MMKNTLISAVKKIMPAILIAAAIFSLAACSKQKHTENLNSQENMGTTYGEEMEIDEAQSKYMYGFDAGTLVLRTENYSDVIRADTIDESDREALGFWPIVNTDSSLLYNGVVFTVVNKVEGNTLVGDAIMRYDKRGIKTELYTTEGYLRLIACEDDCLYFYEHDSKVDSESYLRLNNCFSADVTVDRLAEMPVADIASDNGQNALVKMGEWIYFLYTDAPEDITSDFWYSPNMWLYRLSEKTGEIERVESVYNSLSAECRELSASAHYNGYYMLEGIVEDNSYYRLRNLYLYDFQGNHCTLLCQSYMSGSEVFFVNDTCYHIHGNAEDDVYWAATAIDGSASCKEVSAPMHNSLSHFSSTSSVRICGERFLYTGAAASYAYWIPLDGNADSFEIQTTHVTPEVYYLDGVTYLYVNGAVIYTDNEHAGQWFDSGIRFAEYELYGMLREATFTEVNGSVYFVTYDSEIAITTDFGSEHTKSDLNDLYNTVKIQPDFSRRVESQSGLLQANVQWIKPTILEGVPILDYELEDIYGNKRTGTVFGPALNMTESVEYFTDGKAQYMTGVIIVDKYSLSDASAQICVYADDKLVYESPIITVNSEPVELHVDIKKASVVRVEAVSPNTYNPYQPMDNIRFVLTGESFHNLEFLPYQWWLLRSRNLSEIKDDSSIYDALIIYEWYWQGFRMSDSWTYVFYDTGKYTATNEAGAEPVTGTYSLSGDILTLYSDVESVFVYDKSSEAFISTTNKKLVEQDYVDENGIYHEPVYEFVKLIPQD